MYLSPRKNLCSSSLIFHLRKDLILCNQEERKSCISCSWPSWDYSLVKPLYSLAMQYFSEAAELNPWHSFYGVLRFFFIFCHQMKRLESERSHLAVVFFQYRTSITSRFLRWRRIFSHTGNGQLSWCLEYFSFFSPFSFTTEDISRLLLLCLPCMNNCHLLPVFSLLIHSGQVNINFIPCMLRNSPARRAQWQRVYHTFAEVTDANHFSRFDI